MVWKLTKKAEGREPIVGVPWRDLDDDEFRRVAKEYAAQGFPPRALHGSGYFEHIDDKSEAPASGGEE